MNTEISKAGPASVSAELKEWIVSQSQAGVTLPRLRQAMLDAGWSALDTQAAIEAVLGPQAAGNAAAWPAQQLPAGSEQSDQAAVAVAQQQASADGDRLPAAVRVPELPLGRRPATLQAGDRRLKVLMALELPRVVVLEGLLTPQECEEIIARALPRMKRSRTVDSHSTSGGTELNADRTSEGMFFKRGEAPVVAALESRIASLLDWPLENGEGLQVLCYGPGAQYKPHHDYFEPGLPGTAAQLKRGGQRVATLLVYLNTPPEGGATVFPEAGLEITAQQGMAVFFSYERAHPVSRSLHGGQPVLSGQKWVATKWLREGAFD